MVLGPSHIGIRLKSARKSLGVSQTDMATRFGASRSTWDNYENGRTKPPSDVLEGLVALGFGSEWLLTGAGAMVPADEQSVRQAAYNVAYFFGENLPALGRDGKKFAEEFISVVDFLSTNQDGDPMSVVSLSLERLRAADQSS